MSLLIALVLMLASPTQSAPPQLMCAEACIDMGDYRRCWFEMKTKCGRREVVCIESDDVECAPLIVNLGTWNPSLHKVADRDVKPQSYTDLLEVRTLVPESYEMKKPQ